MKGVAVTLAEASDFVSRAVAAIARQLVPPTHVRGERSASQADMGLLAKLRRFDPVTQGRACLFETTQVLLNAGVEDQLGGAAAARLQLRWAVLVHCLALAKGAHQAGGRSPGEALAHLNYSEARLRQLLQADEDLLLKLMPLLARRLAAHGTMFDWLPLARLLLHADIDEPRADAARAWIARGYIQAATRANKAAADTPASDDSL